MTIRLDNKLAVVTGGTRGIGQAIAYQLKDAGAAVIVNIPPGDSAFALTPCSTQ